ncbi:MAG: hypothetical protein QM500_05220 [Methylococcales bacterium]
MNIDQLKIVSWLEELVCFEIDRMKSAGLSAEKIREDILHTLKVENKTTVNEKVD